jgi:hypothetical protein
MCAAPIFEHSDSLLPKSYVRIVAFAPNLHRAFLLSCSRCLSLCTISICYVLNDIVVVQPIDQCIKEPEVFVSTVFRHSIALGNQTPQSFIGGIVVILGEKFLHVKLFLLCYHFDCVHNA